MASGTLDLIVICLYADLSFDLPCFNKLHRHRSTAAVLITGLCTQMYTEVNEPLVTLRDRVLWLQQESYVHLHIQQLNTLPDQICNFQVGPYTYFLFRN